MQETLVKLNELIVDLENKNVLANTIVNNNLKKEAELAELISKQKQQDFVLKNREDAISSKESAANMLDAAKKLKQDAVSISAENLQDSKNLGVIKESLDKKSKETLELVDLYKRKLASVDAKEIALAEEKKNLRKIILDEIKGKL